MADDGKNVSIIPCFRTIASLYHNKSVLHSSNFLTTWLPLII